MSRYPTQSPSRYEINRYIRAFKVFSRFHKTVQAEIDEEVSAIAAARVEAEAAKAPELADPVMCEIEFSRTRERVFIWLIETRYPDDLKALDHELVVVPAPVRGRRDWRTFVEKLRAQRNVPPLG